MTIPEPQQLLEIAEEAARTAAAELLTRFSGRAAGVRSKSTPTDLVSDADLAAESAIRGFIGRQRPDDVIIGEEGGETGAGELRWVVDPLDGTVNFLFGIPQFAVSIACANSSETLAGVVLDPIRDECFTAIQGGPAEMNGRRITASARAELATAMVATGFGYDASVRERQAAVLARVLPQVRDIRRGGAAALDLAWSACGRYDAYYERGLHDWDLAAGALIAQRAGLVLRSLPESGADAWGVVVAPRALIDELYELVSAGDE